MCQRILRNGCAATLEIPLCCASCPCPLHGSAILCALAGIAQKTGTHEAVRSRFSISEKIIREKPIRDHVPKRAPRQKEDRKTISDCVKSRSMPAKDAKGRETGRQFRVFLRFSRASSDFLHSLSGREPLPRYSPARPSFSACAERADSFLEKACEQRRSRKARNVRDRLGNRKQWRSCGISYARSNSTPDATTPFSFCRRK